MTRPLRTVDAQAEGATGALPSAQGGLFGSAVNELRVAMAMLTRLPVGGTSVAGTGVRAFPIVGALLGLATFVPLVTLGGVTPVASAILAVATLAILSGGLHLDGLADTFDALVAVGPDAAERARRDPAVGAAGATALILVLGLDVAGLTALLESHGALLAGLACVVAGAVSRLMPVALARLARHATPAEGLGAWFVRRTTARDVIVALTTCLVMVVGVSLVAGRPEPAFGAVAAGVGSVGIGLWLVRLRGQLDGDLLGASVEIAFTLTILATAVLAGWPQA